VHGALLALLHQLLAGPEAVASEVQRRQLPLLQQELQPEARQLDQEAWLAAAAFAVAAAAATVAAAAAGVAASQPAAEVAVDELALLHLGEHPDDALGL
jgi:hypothetical protein